MMADWTFTITDPNERLFVEQAIAMYREMERTCREAPHGHVLARAEQVAVTRGRELTRRGLETVLNAEANTVEKKGRRRGAAPSADKPNGTAGASGVSS
jgi:hypothetical protein